MVEDGPKNTVLIAGAGLGGLCLAQALRKYSIPFKIFEKDLKQDFRAQGYRLRITENGILSLQYALTPELWDLFEKTCAQTRPMGPRIDAFTAESVPGEPIRVAPHGNMKPYTVDRSTMRDVLMTGLENNLQFGKAVTHFDTSDEGVTVHFADGTSEYGGLLVGADGVRSNVRKQHLPDYVFIDTGLRIIFGKTPITPQLEGSFVQEAQSGMGLVVENHEDGIRKTMALEAIHFTPETLVGHIKLPDDYMYWVISVHKDFIPLPDHETLRLKNDQAGKLALSLTERWHPRVKSLIEAQDTERTSVIRICSVDPDIPDWKPSQHVTFVGDAIHTMPPMAASGVNTALHDAAELARKLVEAKGVQGIKTETVEQYERDLRERARKVVAMSFQAARKSFGLLSEKFDKVSF